MPKPLEYRWPKDLAEVEARLKTIDSLIAIPPSIDRRVLCAVIWALVRLRESSRTRAGLVALNGIARELPRFQYRLGMTKRDLTRWIEPILLSGLGFGEDENRRDLEATLRFLRWLDAATKQGFKFKPPKVSRDAETLRKLAVLDVLLAIPRGLPQEEVKRATLVAMKKPAPLSVDTILRICDEIAFGDAVLGRSRFHFERKKELATMKRASQPTK